MKSAHSGKQKHKIEAPHPLGSYSVEEIIGLEYRFHENKFDYATVQKLVQIYTVYVADRRASSPTMTP